MERLRKKPNVDGNPDLSIPIPYDIVLAIFCNLTAKTLCRLKCVCKDWHSWISDPKFSFPGKGRDTAILYSCKRPYCHLPGEKFFSLDHQLHPQEIPTPGIDKFSGIEDFRFLGSCNGLLFIQYRDASNWNSNFYSWNPTTTSCRRLRCLDGLKWNIEASGLCFDESTDDYKVALMFSHTLVKVPHPDAANNYTNLFTDVSFQIASLRKGMVWKRCSIPYNIVCTHYTTQLGVFANGHLHWIVKDLDGEYLIVCFDKKTNQLKKLPIPAKLMDSESIYELGVLNGCLCIFRYEFDWVDVSFSQKVFIMREYGVEESWTAILLFNPLRSRTPRRLTTFGSKLLIPQKRGPAVSAYDVKDMMEEDIHLPEYQYFEDGPVVCEQTLASILSFKI